MKMTEDAHVQRAVKQENRVSDGLHPFHAGKDRIRVRQQMCLHQ